MTSTRPIRPVEQVRVPEQLIIGNRAELKAEVLLQFAANRDVVLEFSHTGYIDSSGLGVLMWLAKKAVESGRQLVLAGLNPDLRELFDLLHIAPLLQCAPDTATAMAMINGG